MCGQHGVGATTGKNTDKGHTRSTGMGINIPDPAGNRGRNSTDHGTATDYSKSSHNEVEIVYCYFSPRVRKSRYWGETLQVPPSTAVT